MGITVAQKLEVTGGGLTATFTATNTGGNMLLFSGRTANLTGVTDSQGNSWTAGVVQANGAGGTLTLLRS